MLKGFYIKISIILSNLFKVVYTICQRPKFGAFGGKSRIYPWAVLESPQGISVGNDVTIREGAWLNTKGRRGDGRPALIIGDGTYIGRGIQINAWQDVVIESNVLIGDRVLITDADHCYSDRSKPIIKQGDEFKGRVLLCSGCWIGIGGVIMPGVRIGRNAVVASNSLVISDVPDYTVAGGVPAKIIKSIGE
ncbi:MAG: acyltransferase [Candidatus Omnitrophota bacterium]